VAWRGVAWLLKTISHLGYVPDPMPQIPEEVRAFVAGQLGLLCDSSDAYTTEALTFHSICANYFRFMRRPKIGHHSVSGLQLRSSHSLDKLPY
jgi:hypothetical protein